MIDVRGVYWEGTLNGDTEGDLTDSEGLAYAGVLATDYYATEDLDTGLGALDNLYVDVQRIAGAEFWDVIAQDAASTLSRMFMDFQSLRSSG